MNVCCVGFRVVFFIFIVFVFICFRLLLFRKRCCRDRFTGRKVLWFRVLSRFFESCSFRRVGSFFRVLVGIFRSWFLLRCSFFSFRVGFRVLGDIWVMRFLFR